MKSSYLWAVLATFLYGWAGHAEERIWTPSERQREAEQASLWAGKLAEAAMLEPDKKFEALWLGLRNMGHRKTIPGHDTEIDQIFNDIQQLFLSLPGHAEYFAELIEKERAELQPGEYRGSYDRRRYWFLCETLRHLPSPETVRVLGRYLEDDRDTYPPPPPGDDSGIDPPNSIIAMKSLLLLELPGAPYPPGRYYWYRSTNELEMVRQWFAPIKSGEKPFSFKGQSVEYRFLPDGTWTTTPIANPPDDGPQPAPRKEPPPPAEASPPPLATPPPPATPSGLPWLWIGAGALTIIAALAALLKSRKASP